MCNTALQVESKNAGCLSGHAGWVASVFSVSVETTSSLTPLHSSAAESPQGPNEDDESQESSHCNPNDDGQAQRP